MKKINGVFLCAFLFFGFGSIFLYSYLRSMLHRVLCQFIGISSGVQEANLVSAFLEQGNRDRLYELGEQYLVQNGYGITGIDQVTAAAGMHRFFLIFTLFLCMTGLIMFAVCRMYRRRILSDCERICGLIDGKNTQAQSDHKILKSPELEIVRERISRMIQMKKHQAAIAEKEKEHLKEFTQNVYHQIKTPLAGLKLSLEKIEEQEAAAECLEIVDKLSEQVTNLLDIGKFEANLVKAEKQVCDLALLIEDAIYEINVFAAKKGIEICSDLPENSLYTMNYFWMREAVENILKNSCEHSENDKKVRVELKKEKSGYCISIDDQAGGLKQQNAFERYVSSNCGKGKYGIGLHLSKVIIENHFGIIKTMENDVGGTRFLIRLPILKGGAPYQ